METKALIIGTACALLVACGDSKEKAELQNELTRQRIEKMTAVEQLNEANILIDSIMTELNGVSRRFYAIDTSREGGKVKRQKVAELNASMDMIKERLALAEMMDSLNESTKRVIANLHEAIDQKDREISFLRNRVADLEDENADLGMSLEQKVAELESTNASLEQTQASLLVTQARLASAWVAAGDNLLKNVEKIGPLKGRGNMKVIKEVELSMINQAIECYKNAITAGNSNANSRLAKAQAILKTYTGR